MMKQKIIRNIPDDTLAAIEVKAAEAGLSSEEWIRRELSKLAQMPTIHSRYTFKAFGKGGAQVMIKREDGHVRRSAQDCSQEQFHAYLRACDYAERNGSADYEAAYHLLVQNFEEVFPS